MKKIYLNRMEKKTWNHININEKVMTVPYIEFKENEEIIESINDRIRKIPNPGNYTRKDQEHEKYKQYICYRKNRRSRKKS